MSNEKRKPPSLHSFHHLDKATKESVQTASQNDAEFVEVELSDLVWDDEEVTWPRAES